VIYSWNVGNGEPSPTQEWQYACQYENRRNGTVAFRDVLGRTQAAGSGSPDSISAAIVKGVSIEHRKNERKANFRKRYSLKMDKEAVPFPQLKVNLRVGRRIRELVGSWSERPL
jgi:hypothetical protein